MAKLEPTSNSYLVVAIKKTPDKNSYS